MKCESHSKLHNNIGCGANTPLYIGLKSKQLLSPPYHSIILKLFNNIGNLMFPYILFAFHTNVSNPIGIPITSLPFDFNLFLITSMVSMSPSGFITSPYLPNPECSIDEYDNI